MDLREIGLGGVKLDSTGSEQGPVAGCCECGDETSDSCVSESVSYLIYFKPKETEHQNILHVERVAVAVATTNEQRLQIPEVRSTLHKSQVILFVKPVHVTLEYVSRL
jgi:hypothetical protein